MTESYEKKLQRLLVRREAGNVPGWAPTGTEESAQAIGGHWESADLPAEQHTGVYSRSGAAWDFSGCGLSGQPFAFRSDVL